jgi:hypothetical protein
MIMFWAVVKDTDKSVPDEQFTALAYATSGAAHAFLEGVEYVNDSEIEGFGVYKADSSAAAIARAKAEEEED